MSENLEALEKFLLLVLDIGGSGLRFGPGVAGRAAEALGGRGARGLGWAEGCCCCRCWIWF